MTLHGSRRFGSGAVVALGIVGATIALLAFGHIVGWEPTWRTFGVTPLPPPFFDMHVINDYAACASKGVDPYAPKACNVDNFNIPPVWLWVGLLGVDGSDAAWMTAVFVAAAAVIMVLLFRGRPWPHGVFALGAILSPSVMMGVERGNLDLLILVLVGSAALIYSEKRAARAFGALAVLFIGILLKLFPMFCLSLVARFSRRSVIFACATAGLSLIYLLSAMKYILLIRRNVPTTFILSYGYKVIFLGLDQIRGEARLTPIGLGDTWVPAATAAVVLIGAVGLALNHFRNRHDVCAVHESTAGTAFLFGAGIYCGTFLLGTNFIYRLMFLVLCVPQLQDWQIQRCEQGKRESITEFGLYCAILSVLWLNGNAQGHTIFLLVPQLFDWLLFFALATVLTLNLLRTAAGSKLVSYSPLGASRPDHSGTTSPPHG